MNITGTTTNKIAYENMFADCGTDESVKSIEVPDGGLIAIFTNDPKDTVNTLEELYNGDPNGAFSGLGWEKKYNDYKDIPASWKAAPVLG
jgi:hypothetical protein